MRRRLLLAVVLGGAIAVPACGSSSGSASSAAPSPTPKPPTPLVIAGERADSGDAGLYMVNADGSSLRHIPGTVRGDRAPSLSPDGRRIVFVGAEDTADKLVVMNVDGSGRTPLTTGGATADDDVPVWSPDGSSILFLRDHAPGYLLMAIKPDGSGEHQITSVADTTDELIHPSWSPDSRYVVFEDAAAPDTTRDLYVIRADGTGRVRLGAPGRPVQDYQPSWSPTGTQIAFVEEASPDRAIFVTNVDGTGAQRLSGAAPTVDTSPAWSPDGRQIAFERPGSSGGEIDVMNSDGSNVRPLPLIGVFHTPGWATGPSLAGVHVPSPPTPSATPSPSAS